MKSAFVSSCQTQTYKMRARHRHKTLFQNMSTPSVVLSEGLEFCPASRASKSNGGFIIEGSTQAVTAPLHESTFYYSAPPMAPDTTSTGSGKRKLIFKMSGVSMSEHVDQPATATLASHGGSTSLPQLMPSALPARPSPLKKLKKLQSTPQAADNSGTSESEQSRTTRASSSKMSVSSDYLSTSTAAASKPAAAPKTAAASKPAAAPKSAATPAAIQEPTTAAQPTSPPSLSAQQPGNTPTLSTPLSVTDCIPHL